LHTQHRKTAYLWQTDLLWQGIVFDNQTFDEELSFDVSELERIFDNNSYLFEPS